MGKSIPSEIGAIGEELDQSGNHRQDSNAVIPNTNPKSPAALQRRRRAQGPAKKPMNLYPGDFVEVRSLQEVAQTLDHNGSFDALPFMEEMQRFCGRRFKVFRRLEKTCVEGYGARLLPNSLLLEGLRCDGSAHDGCQRNCPLLWKEAWLRRVDATPFLAEKESLAPAPARLTLPRKTNADHYFCQSTELAKATTYLFPLSFRRCTAEFCARNINFRTGVRFLWNPLVVKLKLKLLGPAAVQPVGKSNKTPTEALNLQAGEVVEVKTAQEIAATLDQRGRNRGLEFSPQMLPFCGRRYKVKGRVDRAILETTGQMREFKNTVILDEVTCDGHTILGGCSRDVYHLWREIWLRRVAKV